MKNKEMKKYLFLTELQDDELQKTPLGVFEMAIDTDIEISDEHILEKKKIFWRLGFILFAGLFGIVSFILFVRKNNQNYIDKQSQSSVSYVYGENPSDTSLIIADMLKDAWNIEKFDCIILADKNGTSATFSASHLANEKNAPILLIDQMSLDEVLKYIRLNLSEDGILYLLGSTNKIADDIEAGIQNNECVLLFGEDRYETNAKILKETDIFNKEILVCCDEDYGIGISAAATGRPVLLVGNRLNEEQKQLLSENSCEIILIGNSQEFSLDVKSELKIYDKTIEHIGGNNVYEVSMNIANRFFDPVKSIMLVHDMNYANSLCAGPLSAEMNIPIIVLGDTNLEYVINYATENQVETGYFLGMPNSIDVRILNSIFE